MRSRTKNRRRLGVNIDHIATLRQARQAPYPDPFTALPILKKCRVDQVTIHLREDRRHINDADLKKIATAAILPVNLELALTDEMIRNAQRYRPQVCTFVPEKRQEITTEGGLDCVGNKPALRDAVVHLQKKNIRSSIFVDPKPEQIRAAKEIGADAVEINTGAYCHLIESFFSKSGHYAFSQNTTVCQKVQSLLKTIRSSALLAAELGLKVYAGHGLHTQNLLPIVAIPQIEEYNIGHAIISRAIFVGLEKAVREIQSLLRA